MIPNWTKKIIVLTILLFSAAMTSFAQSAPPALPVGSVIGYWGFNDTNWLTAWSLPPRASTNLTSVPSWEGNALQIDDTNAASLFYNVVDMWNGETVTNLSLKSGTFEAWFAPNWDSGDGPGDWARLFEINNFSDTNYTSAFGIYISPDGTGLYVSGRTNNLSTGYLSASLSWNYGEWHYLIFTYDETGTNTMLYLDGQVADSNNIPLGLPAGPYPSTNWFTLGADSTGTRQMHGMMDEIYTYNYALDAETVAEYYAQLSPFVSPLPTTPGHGGFHTMADGPPVLPGGGSDGNTTNVVGSWSPTNMFSPAFRLGIAPPGTNQWNSNANSIVIILNQTTNDTVYQLWSTTNLTPPVNWTVEQTMLGNPATNWTAFVVSMVGRGPQVFFTAVNYSLDSLGTGMPDWWQQEYFGYVGVDPYGDPKGDGYSNLYKFQNGMNPNVFYQPAAPTGFTAALNTNGSIIFSWQPVLSFPSSIGGALTGYVLRIAATSFSPATNIILSATATNYTFNPATVTGLVDFIDQFLNFMPDIDPDDGQLYENEPPTVGIQAQFANTNSLSVTARQVFEQAYSVNAAIVRGPQGALYLAVSAIPQQVNAIRVEVGPYGLNYPLNAAYITNTFGSYEQFDNPATYPTFLDGLSYFDVPVTSLVNGVYQIPPAQAPLFGAFTFTVMGEGADGSQGYPQYVSPTDDSGYDMNNETINIPFLDGRTNIAQNINILLRGADNMTPFGASVAGAPANPFTTSTDYVFAGFYFRPNYPATAQIDEFEPFEDNYLYNCLAFNLTNFNSSGTLTNGLDFSTGASTYVDLGAKLFSVTNYVHSHTNFPLAAIPPLAMVANTASLLTPSPIISYEDGSFYTVVPYGITTDGTTFTVPSGARNLYGLPLTSLIYQANNSTYSTATPGHTYPGYADNYVPFYQNVAQPALQTVGYYFARPRIDPMPGDANFTTTNVTPSPIIVPVGQSFKIAAFAKQAVTNGYSGVFAYPQQYFDKAFLANTNGVATTNQTGILSEYGDFFPTQPGQIILTTKPDVATGATGQVTINVIKLQLDINHDGTMDNTFAGPDNTSVRWPFVFWLNNDNDRWNSVDCGFAGIGCDEEQDDLRFGDSASIMPGPTPDCNLVNMDNVRFIPCTRDLEDFTRLWTAGVTSELLTALPTNSIITLTWGDVGSPNPANPTIDLFAAVETDGGAAYLTNGDIATNQIRYSPYVGRLGPGQSIELNACEAGNCWRGNYFIWCGVSNGTGNLRLTFSQGGTNVFAQTAAAIQLLDVKQMYERWTVGDEPRVAPLSTAYLAGDGLPPGVTRFLYGPPLGTNTPYILHVHGSNMKLWEKDRFAETMFKRLYWQAYQGRFGSFRWPTDGGFTGSTSDLISNPSFFDQIEFTAWKSAPGLKKLLTALNGEYPGHVRLSSHSMGNVVAGEALKQCTNGVVVSVYASFQGAVPSHSYDASATTRVLPMSDDAGEPDAHAHYWTSNSQSYFYGVGGAATYVNYFNANDNVLNIWNKGQNLKPDSSLHYGFISPNTYYTNLPSITLNFPTNTYELFAFCVPARCYALGAQSNVTGVFFTSGQVDLFASPYNFGSAHKGHSAEFRSDNMNRAVFWDKLLDSFGITRP